MSVLQKITELVKYNTVSRDSNLPLIDHVSSYLDDLGVSSYRVESEDGKKSNLYASVGPEETGGVVLSGHTDVVPTDGQGLADRPIRSGSEGWQGLRPGHLRYERLHWNGISTRPRNEIFGKAHPLRLVLR